MACIIINFAASIHCCAVDGHDLSKFPLLLNWCDNTSAVAWINKRCKASLGGRALGRIFIGLLLGSNLGIQTDWISTFDNKIADDISRLCDENGNYDYSQLIHDHDSLTSCRQFQPSDSLLGMIWGALRTNVSPDPRMLAKLQPRALGSITS